MAGRRPLRAGHAQQLADDARAIEAFYRAGGRPTAAWRLLREEGADVPSLPVCCRAVSRDLSPAEGA